MNNRVGPSAQAPPDDLPVTRGTVGVVAPTSGGAPSNAASSSTVVVREGTTDGRGDVGTVVSSTTAPDASQIAAAVAAALAAFPPAGATINPPPAGTISAVSVDVTTTKKRKKKGTGKPKKDDDAAGKKDDDNAGKMSDSNKKPKTGGGKGPNFTKAELENMLELIENSDKMPMCMTDWDAIADKHRTRYPMGDRNGESLRRKFNLLANTKMPTGDPRIPPEVKKAKHIHWRMTEEAGMLSGSPEKEADLSNIHVGGGAFDEDDDPIDFSRGGPFDVDEDDDDESSDDDNDENEEDEAAITAAREKLKQSAKKNSTGTKKLVTPAVSNNFTGTTLTQKFRDSSTTIPRVDHIV